MHNAQLNKQVTTPGLPAVCILQVLKPGAVSVVLMYTSAVAATFSVSLGSFQSIVDGSALNITAVLPAQVRAAWLAKQVCMLMSLSHCW